MFKTDNIEPSIDMPPEDVPLPTWREILINTGLFIVVCACVVPFIIKQIARVIK